MSRLRVFRQTGWFIAGLMTGLPATAAPAEASSMAGVAVAVATTTPPDATATLQAIQSCRRESAALERLDCYDRLLAPLSPSGFDGALVKAGFVGEAWTRATEQEKRREGNTTELLVTQVPGERPTVVITTPAIGHVPPRPVLMFSCVDNITRMQVALMHPLDVHDIAVTLNADNRALRSHWFVRENGGCVVLYRQRLAQLFHANIALAGNNPQVTAWHGEHLNEHMADGNFRCLLTHTFRGGHLQRLAGEQVQPFYQRGKINLDHKRPYRSNLFSWCRMSCVWLSSRNR
jgi:type VI secretion system protein VasI